MAKLIFQKILEEGTKRGTLPRSSHEATRWYRQKAKQTKVTPHQLLANKERHKHYSIGRLLLGNMYCFFYEAESLPYWDSFPLVIPIDLALGGFLGINFHYLDWELRAALMDQLLTLQQEGVDESDDSAQSQKGKLDWRKISYAKLSRYSRYKYFKPCLKRYKFENMRSRMIQLDMNEWDVALFLPLEKFMNEQRTTIWANSRASRQR